MPVFDNRIVEIRKQRTRPGFSSQSYLLEGGEDTSKIRRLGPNWCRWPYQSFPLKFTVSMHFLSTTRKFSMPLLIDNLGSLTDLLTNRVVYFRGLTKRTCCHASGFLKFGMAGYRFFSMFLLRSGHLFSAVWKKETLHDRIFYGFRYILYIIRIYLPIFKILGIKHVW